MRALSSMFHHTSKGLLTLMLATVATAACSLPARAGDKPEAPPAPEPKPDYPPLDKVTEGMKKIEGFFTLYHDKKKDDLLIRIPGAMIGKKFMFASTITSGRRFTDYQWNDGVVYFEKIDKRLVLMGADPRYKEVKGPLADVVQRTYTDPIIAVIPIKTMAGADPVFDAGDLLMTDLLQLSMIFGSGINRGLSSYAKLADYPLNTEIEVKLAVGKQYAGVHYSMSQLPASEGFQPREADTRIGYFLTVQKDWAADRKSDTLFKRYINRWHLRKAQPDAAVSDVHPDDQIVYYIEKSVPVKYRRYVREGILEWNKAFEKAGIRNAIAVYQQTDNMHADKDPADVRYNFFRWIVSGTPFAMGPSRANPYTGEILDADIIFDDAYIRYWEAAYQVHGPKPVALEGDTVAESFYHAHADWAPFWEKHEQTQGIDDHLSDMQMDDGRAALRKFMDARKQVWGTPRNFDRCEIGYGATQQLAMAALIAGKNGARDLPEEFIGEAIKETVMHEVGHTLGLRHNFKASSWKPLSEMRSMSADKNMQLNGSVMDYNPYIYAENEESQGFFATPTLGPYDYKAIAYGYKAFMPGQGDDAPKNEAEMLAQIASQIATPGLDYATDEDTSRFYPDPYVNRWDNGKDPIDFARYQVSMVDRLWKDGLDWVVKEGDSRSKARDVFSMLLGQYAWGGVVAARIVGGAEVNRDHKGDAGDRPAVKVVDAAKQREALNFVCNKMLAADSFKFSPKLLNSLAAGRWGHWQSDDFDDSLDFDVHDQVRGVQSSMLVQLLNPFTLNRVYDNELRVVADSDTLTLVELFETVGDQIWSELGKPTNEQYTNRKPMIPSFRRTLQRDYLETLINVVLTRPGTMMHADVQAVARMELKGLKNDIDTALARGGDGLDAYTKAHLMDSQSRIDRALQAVFAAR